MPHPENPGPLGVFITGELVGAPVAGNPYTDRNGAPHTPGLVDLLVGRYVERVEYNDLTAAQEAVGEAQPRTIITLAVRPTGPWDAGSRRWGRVSYRGRSE